MTKVEKILVKVLRKLGLICAGGVVLGLVPSAFSAPAKNIILMISDGQGYNTVKATDYYAGNAGVYESFLVQYGMQTYSAASSDPMGYDPSQAWSNFDYVKANATDSSSAATAMYTGVKIYDGQINVDPSGNILTTIAEIADGLGKSTGAVSSVQFSHATPATVWSHNVSRNNYSEIANEMIYQSGLDVIIGAGHPLYNDNHQLKSANYKYVGGETTWNDITDADGANGFTFVESQTDFEAIANGSVAAPSKLLGVPQVGTTLQQSRSGDVQMVNLSSYNTGVPSLATLSKASLNVLSQNANGFFVMIEGGAIDWANHANQGGRMIEEQMDFNASVQAVVDWVNANSSWEETLLIVTADHECGYLGGPVAGQFGEVVDNGVGSMPGMAYNSGSHTNALVPLYAMGAGSELFAAEVIGCDSVRGAYIDNTGIFHVMNAVVPEPMTIVLLVFGGLSCLAGRSRR